MIYPAAAVVICRLFSAPLPKPVFVFLYGQGGDFNVLDAGPAVAALDEGDKGIEGGTLALASSVTLPSQLLATQPVRPRCRAAARA